MKLYGALLSPFVRKTAFILDIKALDYEVVTVIPGSPPDGYEKISPLLKIPALTDGDLNLADSTVICEYLEEQYPAIATKPSTPTDRAKARWLEEYADTTAAEAVVGIFFERLVKPTLMGQPTDETRVAKLIDEQLPKVQDYLEQQLPEQGFIFGDIGCADISVVTLFINAGYADYVVNQQRWPKLRAFIDRTKEHPVLAKLLNQEQEMLAMLTAKP